MSEPERFTRTPYDEFLAMSALASIQAILNMEDKLGLQGIDLKNHLDELVEKVADLKDNK